MPNDNDNDERRLHQRVSTQLSVRSRLIDPHELPMLASSLGRPDPPIPALNLIKAGSKVSQVNSINLSLGGLSASGDLEINSERAYTKGADLVVEIDLPDEQPPVRAVAQVMWTREEGGHHHMGLMFLLIADSAYLRIQDHLKQQQA
jgi:hypothetical protein